ncbi:MAG: hypothetical protein ABS86_02165 [Sphingobium sp. SCN 64-10]|nr:MAG: hypothetical protein ABS86_02165 [Sphingobium sp. SCN 64-10]
MPRSRLNAWVTATDGAVAPTVALSLVALIGIGGVAFDYARMAGMHSELQNAADQAALAAATQLDGKTDARSRATAAVTGIVSNLSRLADDKGAIAVPTVQFFQDQGTTAATSDANARFVRVRVDGREVSYALTPIVGAFSSGLLDATAMAGMGSAVCKVPPVMICNPAEATDPSFTVANYERKGLLLVGNGSWSPGNFGFLQGGENGNPGIVKAVGWVSLPFDCTPGTGVSTKPGNMGSTIADAFNTRFDVGDAGSCPSGGSCPASANSTKDLVKDDSKGNNACVVHNKGWQEASKPYVPSSNAALPSNGSADPNAMGYPRDICHASNSVCAGQSAGSKIGDGVWDVDAYFRVNYGGVNRSGWMAATGLAANATRYEVYRWEMAHAGTPLNGYTVLGTRTVSGSGANALKARGAPYCSPSGGLTPGGSTPDRRRLSVAVVNCTANGVNGNSTNLPVEKWLDVFLVEPVLKRDKTYKTGTASDEVYVEVIGETGTGSNGTAGQVVQRNVPYLVK